MGELAEFGADAGGEDHRLAAAAQHGAAGKDDVVALRQAAFHRRCPQRPGLRLAGERGVVDQEVVALHQPGVGGDAVPLGDQQYVSRHQLLGEDALRPPFAGDRDLRRQVTLQGRHRPLRPVFLDEAETGIEHGDAEQRPAKHSHALPRLDGIGNETEAGGGVEQQGEEMDELVQQPAQPLPAIDDFHRVAADFQQPLRHLAGVQSLRPAAEDAEYLFGCKLLNLPRGAHGQR